MPLIGTRAHAQVARHFTGPRPLPDGWRFLGSGSYRNAYLHNDTNVVYKVDNGGGSSCCTACDDIKGAYSSIQELRASRMLRKREFQHVRIPLVSGFTVLGKLILAMEYVKPVGIKRAMPDEAYIELYRLGFADMHGENFFVDADRKLVPVDMASPRNQGADLRCLSYMRDGKFAEAEAQRRWNREW